MHKFKTRQTNWNSRVKGGSLSLQCLIPDTGFSTCFFTPSPNYSGETAANFFVIWSRS